GLALSAGVGTLIDNGNGTWSYTPAANDDTAVAFSYTITDGTATVAGSATHDIIPVNDAPVNTVPGVQTVTENTPLALGGISVNDVDGNVSTVQLAVTNGTVTVNLAGGATISLGSNGTNTLTLSGNQIQINAALGTLTYQGTLNYNGPDTLTVTTTDSNAVTDMDTVAITVTPVNSAPTLVTNAGATVFQGLSDPITSGELQVTDANNTPAQLIYTVTTPPVNGHLELLTAPGVAIMSFTQAEIDAGQVLYVNNGANSTSDSFIFTLSDGAGGTIGATTFNITVTPFFPPPVPVPVPVPPPLPIPVPTLLPPVITPPPGGGVVTPVLPPPVPLWVQGGGSSDGAKGGGTTDEAVRRVESSGKTFIRVEQPVVGLDEPAILSLEPLSNPVKTIVGMSHKLAEHLTRLADDLERAAQEREHQAHLLGRVASVSGFALSAGFVAWILRGGSLLASFLVSMPAWRHFDPLPVLGGGEGNRRKLDRKAREEQKEESQQFRGLDRVLNSSAKAVTQQKTERMRRPKP
ncbi:MAG TPA: cadherin-like domain-containing protein, partial [Nitrospiraceae bacterium]|nr:cadherin-like domain-containing protein [Nitrospiraceae bacterium]